MPLINGKYYEPGRLFRRDVELVVYDGKIHLSEYPVDGMCLVQTPTKRIDKVCKVDRETRDVVCNLKGYKGYLVVSYLTESSDMKTWGGTYSKPEYQFVEKRYEEICGQNKSVMGFDGETNSFVWRSENYKKDIPDKFSIVLWAGTVGIGLREDGSAKEIHRSEQEAWNDFLVKTSIEESTTEIVNDPAKKTVKRSKGTIPITISVTATLISLIGFMVSGAAFWQILLLIEVLVLEGVLGKFLI